MPTVIKAGEAVALKKRLATVDLSDHLAEARTILERARCEAQQMIVEAQRGRAEGVRDVSEALREARERGFREGHEEGRARGYQEGSAAGFAEAQTQAVERFAADQAHLVSMLKVSIAEFDRVKDELAVAAERELLEFAVLIARKLTFAIGDLHHEAALAGVTRALRLVESQTDVRIQVHPADLAALEFFVESNLRPSHDARHVTVHADGSIAPGGCRVMTSRTSIDATLETQVEEMTAKLLGEEVRGTSARQECGDV